MSELSKEEVQLIFRKFINGDEHAFQTLFNLFYNKLLLYGNAITGHHAIVEDQIQELFIWLYNHPQQCRSIRNIETYLFLSLKKNLKTYLQKDIDHQIRLRKFGQIQEAKETSIEDHLIWTNTQESNHAWLANQIDQLPPRMKQIIYLRYYEGMAFDDIAEIMSIKPQVAQNFAYRALKKLRLALPLLERFLSFLPFFLWV